MRDEKGFNEAMKQIYIIDTFMIVMLILSRYENNEIGICFCTIFGIFLTIVIVGLKIMEWSYKLYQFFKK